MPLSTAALLVDAANVALECAISSNADSDVRVAGNCPWASMSGRHRKTREFILGSLTTGLARGGSVIQQVEEHRQTNCRVPTDHPDIDVRLVQEDAIGSVGAYELSTFPQVYA